MTGIIQFPPPNILLGNPFIDMLDLPPTARRRAIWQYWRNVLQMMEWIEESRRQPDRQPQTWICGSIEDYDEDDSQDDAPRYEQMTMFSSGV